MLNTAAHGRVTLRASEPQSKQTHKLTPQTCVVWVPGAGGYAARFERGALQVATHPESACHLTEEKAEDLALALCIQLKLRVAIRPYYGHCAAASGAGFKASPMVITGITSGARKND